MIKLHKNYTSVHPMWEITLPRLNIVTKPLPFNCVALIYRPQVTYFPEAIQKGKVSKD